MYRLIGQPPAPDGILDIAMTDWRRWPATPGMTDLGFQALMMGDAEAGPYLALVAIPPRTEPLPKFPAHGHGTDTWRITLAGEMNMGTRKYLAGEFRYQLGGRAYGSDDLAWGAEDGLSIVMMADRRGSPSFPPDHDPEKIRVARARTKPLFDWLGFEMQEDYAAPHGIATTLKASPRALMAEGALHSTTTWYEVAPGVRVAAGLAGEARVGPVLLHIDAAPGTVAWPASRFETEVLHIGVSGGAMQDDRRIGMGDLRLLASGKHAHNLTAGEHGYRGTLVFGSRQALGEADIATSGLAPAWAGWLTETLQGLKQQLAARS